MSDYIIVPGNADGKVLTSTEWQQSGSVVIEGQELVGYIYNKFCPWLSPSSRIRSVTGCTNTADAQIIYYYLAQGWDLDLQVSSADYFYLKSKPSRIYYLSESPVAGEGSISEINAILDNTANYASGDFIAALNFFCGVKNHSSYGTSTGTSVYPNTYFDGDYNLKAFKAAGFDSYFSIGNTNELFFDKSDRDNRLTDLAYSIIRENLDYGEPVRLDIPGHSIYLDGYRWNQNTQEYEYHLNFGWGPDGGLNTWYTEDQVWDESVDTLGLDLSPKIRVTVSNGRQDYYGGSFLRGIERINHIQNDTATTFGFVEAIAGKKLLLETVSFTSAADLDFLNWNVCLCVSGGDGLVSDNALTFTNQTGGIIVKSPYGDSCIVGSADEALDADLNGGYYFAGYSELNFEGIQLLLDEFWNNTETLGECVNSDAVVSGSADDVISLQGESVIVGGIDLGGGSNQLFIESGSALYGTLRGADDSVELNLVASDIEERSMIYLTESPEDFLAAVGGNINFIIEEDNGPAVYHLIEFENSAFAEEYLDDFNITVKFCGEDYSLSYSTPSNGNFSLQYMGTTVSLACSSTNPVISLSPSTAEWTNEDVYLTAFFSLAGEAVSGEYSLNNGTSWFTYTSPLKFTQNGKVIFRALGEEGYDYKEYTVSNIDKISPVISDISVDVSESGKRAVVSAVFSDNGELDSLQYKIGNDIWRDYTGEFAVTANGTVWFRAADAAGNIAEKSVEIDQLVSQGRTAADIDGNNVADVLMVQRKSSGKINVSSGAWLISEDPDKGPQWGNLSDVNFFKRILGFGWTDPEKLTADIYLQDVKDNSVGAWIMDEEGQIDSWKSIALFDDETQVVALGDFNGDGVTDLLLQNDNGGVGCSFVTDSQCVWNYFQSLGREWALEAVGDFNNDGLDDIVLTHDAGFAGCWLTQKDGSVLWSNLDTLQKGTQVVGAGDFNGDGVDDVLLQTGNYFGAWIIKDGNAVQWMGLGQFEGTVEQIADFDNDGIDDLRLRVGAGDLGAQLVKGEDKLQWKYFGSVNMHWNTSCQSL